MLFIDEIHRIARPAEETALHGDGGLPGRRHRRQGARAPPRSRWSSPPFTLVGATTRAGLLTGPLRDRFGFVGHLDFYDAAELEQVLRRSAACSASRSTPTARPRSPAGPAARPRIANRLLRRVRDYAEVRPTGVVTLEVAHAALAVYDVDELGLDRLDRAVLTRWSTASAAARSASPRSPWRSARSRDRRGGRRAVPGPGRPAGPHPARPGGHRRRPGSTWATRCPGAACRSAAGTARPRRRTGFVTDRCSTPRLHGAGANPGRPGVPRHGRPAHETRRRRSYPSGPSPGRTHRASRRGRAAHRRGDHCRCSSWSPWSSCVLFVLPARQRKRSGQGAGDAGLADHRDAGDDHQRAPRHGRRPGRHRRGRWRSRPAS